MSESAAKISGGQSAFVVHPKQGGRRTNDPARRTPEASLAEAVGLAQAIGLTVRHAEVVSVQTPNPKTFLGEGRITTMKGVIAEEKIDVLIINDGEARALGQDSNLVKVAKQVLARGPKHLIIKRGEYGVLMFNGTQVFGAPAFPLEDVRDPTGAGDTFAGGFLGYLAATGNRSPEAMKQAIIFGSVMASFTVESFSLDRLRILDYKEIQARFQEFKRLTHFEDVS